MTVFSRQVIRHPNYNSNSENNDIALIRLPRLAETVSGLSEVGRFVMPVCLPLDGRLPSGYALSIAGWGSTSNFAADSDFRESGVQTTLLQFAGVDLVPMQTCKTWRGYEGLNDRRQLCARGQDGMSTTKKHFEVGSDSEAGLFQVLTPATETLGDP